MFVFAIIFIPKTKKVIIPTLSMIQIPRFYQCSCRGILRLVNMCGGELGLVDIIQSRNPVLFQLQISKQSFKISCYGLNSGVVVVCCSKTNIWAES